MHIFLNFYLHVRIFAYLCSPKNEGSLRDSGKCGEIWLLATTIKNAKMLTIGHQAMVTAFISMFCVFV